MSDLPTVLDAHAQVDALPNLRRDIPCPTLKVWRRARRTARQGAARSSSSSRREGELSREGSMQILHRTPDGGRPTTFYDLDVIISVGYRVRSTRGTQFRIWATGILRDYLRRGYALNEKRLAALGIEAEQAIELPATTMEQQRLTSPEGAASWMSSDATRARGASCGRMTRTTSRPRQHKLVSRHRTDARRRAALPEHRIAGRASALFRRQGPPADRRNKRTASPLFLEYLRRNDALVRADGQLRSSDTALTALTLLVAESKPTHKDLVIRLVLNLLAEDRP